MYSYNEETGEVTKVKMPRLNAEDSKRIESMKPNKKFLKKIMAMKLNVEMSE